MEVAVTGATGQMGEEVIKTARARGHKVTVAVDKTSDGNDNIEVEKDDILEDVLEEREPDVIIDFTAPEATCRYLEAAGSTGTPIVVGTTGFDQSQIQELEDISNEVPVLKASNFSPGMNIMFELVEKTGSSLSDYDIEIVESHHNRKKDSPSGTAKTLLKRIKSNLGKVKKVYGRSGESIREENEVGIHSIRAGDIRGEHRVIFAGNDEVLEIKHRSESREVFAAGALDAAEFLVDREAGYYDFDEVISQ